MSLLCLCKRKSSFKNLTSVGFIQLKHYNRYCVTIFFRFVKVSISLTKGAVSACRICRRSLLTTKKAGLTKDFLHVNYRLRLTFEQAGLLCNFVLILIVVQSTLLTTLNSCR